MAFRIVPTEQSILAPPVKDKTYLAWIHELNCVITGAQSVQAAHVSFDVPTLGAYGRGKSQKASDRFTLPLHPDKHDEQTNMGDERAFWRKYEINPHMVCLVLYGLFCERGYDDSIEHAYRVLRQVRNGAPEFKWSAD